MAFQRADNLSLNRGGVIGTAGGATGTYYVDSVAALEKIIGIPTVADLGAAPTVLGPKAYIDNTVSPDVLYIWDTSASAYVAYGQNPGAMTYQGTWNANTGTPALPAAAVANKGHVYVVSVAGATSVGGITDWEVGDWVVSNGAAWEKIDNTEPSATATVAGNVELATDAEAITGTDATRAITPANLTAVLNDHQRWMAAAAAP